MVEELEQAVAIAMSQESSTLKNSAINYCNELKNSADGWKLCLKTFEITR